jgi:GH25 family lysozyme M1 (1,4-beta-N-acetylmuramidase)
MKRAAFLAVVFLMVGCGAEPGEPLGEIMQPVSQCPMQTAEGVDVSDHNGTIDWTAVKKSGRAFAFMKATQGTYNTQATFAANWSRSRAAGVFRSPYHFFDPREDGVAQADRFLGVVGQLQQGDLAPMLDLECPDGDPNCLYTGEPGNVSGALVVSRALAWLQSVEQRTGRKPIIYSYPAWFASLGTDVSKFAHYALFIATLSNCASVPAPWKKTDFWQYSWTGVVPGIPGEVDVDRFMGSAADLAGFADGGAAATSTSDAAAIDAGLEGDAADVTGTVAEEADAPATMLATSDASPIPTEPDASSPHRADGAVAPHSPSSPIEEAGCACNLPASKQSRASWWLLLALVVPMRRRLRTFGQRDST